MRQEFNCEVGDVAGRDIINQVHHDQGRPLTFQERIELNRKVKQLEEFDRPGWETWRTLHGVIGIESIEAMRLGHRDTAHAILKLLHENATLERSLKDCRAGGDAGEIISLQSRNGELAAKLEALQMVRQQLEGAALRARRRASWLALCSAVLALVASGAAYAAYDQAQRAAAINARLILCDFEGRTYTPGSVINGKPDLECVIGEGGATMWQGIVASKATRGR